MKNLVLQELTGTFISIPILDWYETVSPDYIKLLDSIIKTDGCTGVKDIFRDCCVVHDLGYRYRINPWGKRVSRAEVDAAFRECMQSKSWFGKLSPLSWIRWAGVRLFGWAVYEPKVA